MKSKPLDNIKDGCGKLQQVHTFRTENSLAEFDDLSENNKSTLNSKSISNDKNLVENYEFTSQNFESDNSESLSNDESCISNTKTLSSNKKLATVNLSDLNYLTITPDGTFSLQKPVLKSNESVNVEAHSQSCEDVVNHEEQFNKKSAILDNFIDNENFMKDLKDSDDEGQCNKESANLDNFTEDEDFIEGLQNLSDEEEFNKESANLDDFTEDEDFIDGLQNLSDEEQFKKESANLDDFNEDESFIEGLQNLSDDDDEFQIEIITDKSFMNSNALCKNEQSQFTNTSSNSNYFTENKNFIDNPKAFLENNSGATSMSLINESAVKQPPSQSEISVNSTVNNSSTVKNSLFQEPKEEKPFEDTVLFIEREEGLFFTYND